MYLTHSNSYIFIKENFDAFIQISYLLGLNVFLVLQVLMNFGISPSLKFYTNLVFHF